MHYWWRYQVECLKETWAPSKDAAHAWNNLLVPAANLASVVVPLPFLWQVASPLLAVAWPPLAFLLLHLFMAPFRLWLRQVTEIAALEERLKPRLDIRPRQSVKVEQVLWACVDVENLRPESQVNNCRGRVTKLFTPGGREWDDAGSEVLDNSIPAGCPPMVQLRGTRLRGSDDL